MSNNDNSGTVGAATSDLGFSEPLLFESGVAGRCAVSLGTPDVPEVDEASLLGSLRRQSPARWPEVSEPQVVRHYVRLSQQNFAIDKGFYPLGSCTMKYNPKVNEWAARLPGFANLHPYMPDSLTQGALELMWRLERGLAEVCGMDRVSLHPAAGAQGELTGLMMIRAYHQAHGPRPQEGSDSRHGAWNQSRLRARSTVSKAVPFPVGDEGILTTEALVPFVDDDVAAVMVTNPNTVGLFETHMPEIAELIHGKGGLVYGDGANLNALMGKARPGDLGIDVMQFNLHKTFTTPHGGGGPGCGPVGYKAILDPFAPVPVVEQRDGEFTLDYSSRPSTVGRLRSFQGNFGMMVRAYAYLREMGVRRAAAGDGASRAERELPARSPRRDLACALRDHVYARGRHQRPAPPKHTGVTTMDVAKRLMDYGFHPPTVYFPLVVRGAPCWWSQPKRRAVRRSMSSSRRCR